MLMATLPGPSNNCPAGPATPETTVASSDIAFKVSCYEHTQKNYTELLQSGKRSDVTFTITDEDGTCHKIPAHRLVLASQSEYFDRMLFGEMIEAQPGAEIPLPDTPLEAFQLLLKYLYTGSINVKCKLQLILDVITLADRFGLTHLKDANELHLVNVVNHTNVLLIFPYADLLRLERAMSLCLETVDSHASFVLSCSDCLSLSCWNLMSIISRDTFIVDEIEVFRAVKKWMEHNNKAKEDAANLLKAVRLCEIPPRELFGEVECSGLYSKDDIYGAIRIQQKPDWNSTLPRGRIDGGDLFKNEKTTWVASYKDNPTWLARYSSGNGPFQVKFSTLATNYFMRSQYPRGRKPSSVVMKFDDLHLVNQITLQVRKETPYTIQISKDNKQWSMLIDHMKYKCCGVQQLHFPKQAFKYLQFSPVAVGDCEVDFVSCSLSEEDGKAFAIREDQILAPLEAIEPMMHTQSITSAHLVTFNQPYSISALSFSLTTDDSVEYENFDVSVKVAAASAQEQLSLGSFVEVASQPCATVEDMEVKADFAERVVTLVLVELKPVEDVQKGTEKRKVADGSAPSAQVKFSVTSLLCWAS